MRDSLEDSGARYWLAHLAMDGLQTGGWLLVLAYGPDLFFSFFFSRNVSIAAHIQVVEKRYGVLLASLYRQQSWKEKLRVKVTMNAITTFEIICCQLVTCDHEVSSCCGHLMRIEGTIATLFSMEMIIQ